jgi:4-amino-4-deoxy-L-arabinose transferase-like glycosyltransferase
VAGLIAGEHTSGHPPLLVRKGVFWFVATLIALLFCVTNLPWTLDDYDQAKQAFTSFEMVQEGHWLYEHTPNEKIATKPPLIGWVSAATYGVTRSWEVAWRFPSMAAALLLLAAVTIAAKRAYGTVAGLLAMGAFGLNLLSPRLATLARTDMPLALVIFLLGAKIWEKFRAGKPWLTGDRVVIFALLTAAMLIKGPIVYAFLLPGIVAFHFWKGNENASAWSGWWPWIGSLAIFALWVAGGIWLVPGFYEQVVVKEFAGRFGETIHRPQPLYFYFPHLLHKFAPWSLLILALAVAGWRTRKATLRQRWLNLPAEMVWLVCWSLGGLMLMSLIPSKRVDRIFPVVPPLCLLLAAQFAQLSRDRAHRSRIQRWGAVALIVAGLFSAGYAAQRVIISYRSGDDALVKFGAVVRREAAARGWRYEVIGGRDEGLLLYLRRTHFIKKPEAVERWKGNNLDALVAPRDEVAALLRELPGSAISDRAGPVATNNQRREYVLLTKAN